MFYMQPLLEDSTDFLEQMAHHFQTISGNIQQVELYDHSVHVNSNLFQKYFQMSIGLAGELNYLDRVNEGLTETLEAQIANGEINSRNARRKTKDTLEVNNRETKRLTDSLSLLMGKVTDLNTKFEELNAVNLRIEKKRQVTTELIMESG